MAGAGRGRARATGGRSVRRSDDHEDGIGGLPGGRACRPHCGSDGRESGCAGQSHSLACGPRGYAKHLDGGCFRSRTNLAHQHPMVYSGTFQLWMNDPPGGVCLGRRASAHGSPCLDRTSLRDMHCAAAVDVRPRLRHAVPAPNHKLLRDALGESSLVPAMTVEAIPVDVLYKFEVVGKTITPSQYTEQRAALLSGAFIWSVLFPWHKLEVAVKAP